MTGTTPKFPRHENRVSPGLSARTLDGKVAYRMKYLSAIGVGLCCALGSFPSTSTAAIDNNGFESADLLGWTIENPRVRLDGQTFGQTAGMMGVMHAWGVAPDFTSTRAPQQGNSFAALRTRANGNFTGEGTYSFSLNQSLQLDQGDLLSGWAFFYNGDLIPQDSAWVRIFDDGGNLVSTPWAEGLGAANGSSNSSLAPYTTTDWTHWEWEAPTSGRYTLRLGMTTGGDNNGASYGFFDNLNMTPATSVPEPSLLAVATAGLFLLALLQKRR